jgi:hypothetical protein
MIQYKIDSQLFDDIAQQDITLQWEGDTIDIDIGNLTLTGLSKDLIINKVINQQIFEKIPFELLIDKNSIYKGYISFRNTHNLHPNCDYISVSVTRENSVTSIFDLIDNVTVQSLITNNDIQTQLVDYQYSNVPDRHAQGTLLLMILVSSYILNDIVKEITKDIAIATSNPFTINVALGIAFEVVYAGINIIAIVKLIRDFIKVSIPQQKKTISFKLQEAISKGFNKIGYQYLAYNEPYPLSIIPVTDAGTNIVRNNWTLRELIKLFEQYYNLKLKVKEKVVYFEKYPNQTTAYDIQDYTIISKYIDLSDCPSSILIRFSYDGGDANSWDIPTPNSCQVLFNRHGEAKVFELPVARAKRKDKLLSVENLLKDILELLDKSMGLIITPINAAINAINKVVRALNNIIDKLNNIGIKLKRININIKPFEKPDLSANFSNRIGNLLVEGDTWGVDKICLIDGSKIANNNNNIVNAESVYDNYSERYVWEFIEVKTKACYDALNQIIDLQCFSIENKIYQITKIEYNVNNSELNLQGKRILYKDNNNGTKIV